MQLARYVLCALQTELGVFVGRTERVGASFHGFSMRRTVSATMMTESDADKFLPASRFFTVMMVSDAR